VIRAPHRCPRRVRSLLAANSVRALLGTLLGNAVGFILPFAITSHYGFGRLTDAYFFALGFAIFGTVLSATVIEANSLPLINAGKRHGSDGARMAAWRVARQSVAGVLAVYVPVAFCGSLALASKHAWPAELRQSVITLTIVLTLLVVIVAGTSVLAAVMYSFNDFLSPTATQSFRSIAPIVGLLFIGRSAASLEILAWLMVIGELGRGVVLASLARTKLRTLPVGRPMSTRTQSIWRAAGPHAIAMVSVNLMPVVDKIIATSILAAGSVTLIEAGEKIFYVPLLAITYSVILVAGARWAEAGPTTRTVSSTEFGRLIVRVIWLSIVLAGLCILGLACLHIVRPRAIAGLPSGKLAIIGACFMIGLPANAVTNVGSRLFTSLGQTRYLPPIAILLLMLDIGFDLVGAKLWGVYGIALATTGVRVISAPIYVIASLSVLRSRTLASVSPTIAQSAVVK
jgi:peptidoglycan biosynthesis protein MviN/MurJ (putative lipid II flippase)